MERFHVKKAVIDALPETRLAAAFARRHDQAWCAYYGAAPADHGARKMQAGVRSVRLERTQAIDEMVERFRAGTTELPRDARRLGGRVADGSGAYYRELLTPQRTLEQDAQGNWVARWSEHGRADHFAHAEVYCRAANEIAARTGLSMWTLG